MTTSTPHIALDHPPAREVCNATQNLTEMRFTALGAGVVMVVFGAVGLAIAFVTGGQLADARAAYSAGLAGVILAGQMVIAVGGLRSHQNLLRHQLALEAFLEERFESIEERQDGLERLLARVLKGQQEQAQAMGDLVEDELRHRRRNG